MRSAWLWMGLACLPAVLPGAEYMIGATVPDLTLTDLDGSPRSLRALEKGQATVLLFISSLCPISNEYVGRMSELAGDFAGRATIVGINSNRNENAEEARKHAEEFRLGFPVFKDPGSVLADRFGITVTPQAIVLDRHHRLHYRGRIDDSQKVARVTRSDLRLALEAALRDRLAPVAETKAFGCTIKRGPAEAPAPQLPPIDEAGYGSLLGSHRGKVLLVNFWATWCAPCREEMPGLVELEKKLRRRGFVLVTISADEPEQERSVVEFLAQHGVRPPAYLKRAADDAAFISAVSGEWSGALPALFLYSRRGRLARSFIGETSAREIEREARKLL